MAISRRLRFEILRRDNHTCRYCGAQSPDVKLTVDHVTPVALGGRDEPSNLVTACESLDDIQHATSSAVKSGAATSPDVATEEALTEAYIQGYEQGRSDAGSAAQESEEASVSEGFIAAIDWVIDAGRNTPQQRRLCTSCNENEEYGSTGLCLPCWRDQLEVKP